MKKRAIIRKPRLGRSYIKHNLFVVKVVKVDWNGLVHESVIPKARAIFWNCDVGCE